MLSNRLPLHHYQLRCSPSHTTTNSSQITTRVCVQPKNQHQPTLWSTANTTTPAMSLKAVARSAFGGLAFGGFLYLVGDTASDYLTFSRLRAAALALADQDEELQALVGKPYTTGYWYNSMLGFSHREKVAHCTFQLQGSQRVTDVAVKAGRQQAGPASTILYNLVGPGSWQLISCQAMVPSEGGLVAPRSLLPQHREEERQLIAQLQKQQQQRGGGSHGAGGVLQHAAAACQPCQEQEAGSSGGGSGGGSGSSSGRRWWPWSRSSRSSGSAAGGGGSSSSSS